MNDETKEEKEAKEIDGLIISLNSVAIRERLDGDRVRVMVCDYQYCIGGALYMVATRLFNLKS